MLYAAEERRIYATIRDAVLRRPLVAASLIGQGCCWVVFCEGRLHFCEPVNPAAVRRHFCSGAVMLTHVILFPVRFCLTFYDLLLVT